MKAEHIVLQTDHNPLFVCFKFFVANTRLFLAEYDNA